MPKPKERPIIFSGPMVRAILEGRKTQTRRVVHVPKHIKPDGLKMMTWDEHDRSLREQGVPDDARPYLTGPQWSGQRLFGNLRGDVGYGVIAPPLGVPGDLLWVRESAWYDRHPFPDVGFRAFFEYGDVRLEKRPDTGKAPGLPESHVAAVFALNKTLIRRSPVLMPRWASRLTLRITDVRVQRLQEISEEDAIAEGVFDEKRDDGELPSTIFRAYWHHLNGKKPGASWNDNPWVWVYTFEQVTDA